MPIIDVHAHVSPERFQAAVRDGGTWHGLGRAAGQLEHAGFRTPLPQRLADMDAVGIDMQLLSPTVSFYQYHNELATTTAVARDCNDAIAELVEQHPTRFAGLATLPMQYIPSAIDELERAMRELDMKGVIVNDHVNGRTYDEPEFLPFFKAVEAAGAVIFFHQGGDTCVKSRISRYSLPNGVGNLTERTLSFAALVFGGVMDKCPDLKVLLGHGGGYAAFGAGRLDKVAGVFEGGYPQGGLEPPFGRGADDRYVLTKPPSTYLSQFYYDCCTYSGAALRFLIDAGAVTGQMIAVDSGQHLS
jgi:aminocarboxymuconate-semialdehyde decarboxylase